MQEDIGASQSKVKPSTNKTTKETIWKMSPLRKEDLRNTLVFMYVFPNMTQNKAKESSEEPANH